MSNLVQNIIRLKNDSGPWGSYKGGNSGKKPPNSGQDKKTLSDPELDELIRKSQEFVKKIFNSGNNNDNGPENKKPLGFKDVNNKSLLGMILLGFLVLWMASGIYKVDPDENALVLYFGKFYSVATPGLNYHIPAPFGEVVKKSVTTVNTEEFGYSTSRKRLSSSVTKNSDSESLMLTGDENIVDIDFQVQWQISDIKNFVFNIVDPNVTVRKAAESAMREVIAKTPIASALSDGKRKIEQDAKTLLQQILDSYDSGVRVVLVQMRRVDPPHQVIDAFRDVQTAKADREREINQAQAYSNDIIPRARGTVAQIKGQAAAYKQEVIANSEGQANRFLAVYNQYLRAKTATKKRIYLETMEKLLRETDKIIIDKNASKSGVLPYLPINNLKKDKKE